MALFNFGKKEEETKMAEGTYSIKVLGSGCRNCHSLYENTEAAVKNLGVDAHIEYVTDMQKIMEYGVMSMPCLVMDEKVVSMGRVLKTAEIEKLLHKMGF